MLRKLHLPIIVPMAIAGLILAAVPILFLLYLKVLVVAFFAFIGICVLDLLKITAQRRRAGMMLERMFMVAIVALLIWWVIHLFV